MARGGVDLQKLLYSDDLNEVEKYGYPSNELNLLYIKAKEACKVVGFEIEYENKFSQGVEFDGRYLGKYRHVDFSRHEGKDNKLPVSIQCKGKVFVVDLNSNDWANRLKEVLNASLNEEDDQLLNAKEFFEEADKEANAEEIENEEVALNEEANDPEDVVTVKDFIHLLREKTDLDDKLSFRANKKECVLVDVDSKSGTSVVDLVYGKDKMLENEEMNEGNYSWRRGGYGGTGRSYSSYKDGSAPRGAAIGWFAVDQIDPKAKGKMYGWRMGPSNFPFEDLLYPERKYKVGTTTMRNKYVKAGSMSGEKYIAIPSYFSAIKDNDQEAINILNLLGIPLDLTFGMDPNDDYSMTYTVKQ